MVYGVHTFLGKAALLVDNTDQVEWESNNKEEEKWESNDKEERKVHNFFEQILTCGLHFTTLLNILLIGGKKSGVIVNKKVFSAFTKAMYRQLLKQKAKLKQS